MDALAPMNPRNERFSAPRRGRPFEPTADRQGLFSIGQGRVPRKPAIEYDRLIRAMADLSLRTGKPSHRVCGGSTLANQLEELHRQAGHQRA